jgi:hypothetical protein
MVYISQEGWISENHNNRIKNEWNFSERIADLRPSEKMKPSRTTDVTSPSCLARP